MKNIIRNLIIIFLIINLTGCSLPTAPTNLIKPPLADASNLELKRTIEKFLPFNARLTMPTSLERSAKTFYLKDLTQNGQEEIIAFYKIDNSFSLGILVLAKDSNDKWNQMQLIEHYGDDINLVKFIDITGDDKPELLVGLEGGSSLDNQLFIYSFTANKYREIANISYSNFTYGDIDGDGLPEIVINKNTRQKDIPITVLEVYKHSGEGLDLIYNIDFDGYAGEILLGQAKSAIKGIFNEVYLGAHSAATHLIVREGGEFVEVFAQNPDIEMGFKPYPLPSKDVNDDGIIEMGIHKAPANTEHLAMVEIPWVEEWYQWDGEDGLIWLSQVYADYDNSFQWHIPADWLNKYTLTRENSENSSLVEFYDLTEHGHLVFSLLAIDTESWEAEKERLEHKDSDYLLLGENKLLAKIYIAIMPEPKTCRCLKPLNIDLGEIKAGFRMLNEFS